MLDDISLENAVREKELKMLKEDFGIDLQSIKFYNKINNDFYLNLCPDI